MANKIDTNNDGIISLKEYLSFQRQKNDLDGMFAHLSAQLEIIHKHGYCIDNLNADSIIMDGQDSFGYANIVPMVDREYDVPRDIEKFAKLLLGAKLTTEVGFSDYTMLPTPYLKSELDNIVSTMNVMGEDSEYFLDVFSIGNRRYYHNFQRSKTEENGSSSLQGSNVKSKVAANGSGKLYSVNDERQAAYTNILYIGVILLITMLFLVFYNAFQYLIG